MTRLTAALAIGAIGSAAVVAVFASMHGLPAFVRDVGTNVGVGGIIGAAGALAGAAAGGPGSAFGGRPYSLGDPIPPGGYMEPNRRLTQDGQGFTVFPSRAAAEQATEAAAAAGVEVRASPMIYFSQTVHNICAAIAGEGSGTTKSSSCTKA